MSPAAFDRPSRALRVGAARPLLVLLLDGVAYDRMAALYAAGAFRRFTRPARVISVFPTLTDPAYDVLFGTGPTPGYEAGYFDRDRNRLTAGLVGYLTGRNEQWVRHTHYRLNFIADGAMYLAPRRVYAGELRRARTVLRHQLAAGRDPVVIYILSTDALGHMLTEPEIEAHLRALDAWTAGALAEHGDLDLVLLADHGMSALPPAAGFLQSFDLVGVLRSAGLHIATALRRPGDVVVPRLGLLDVCRVHAADAATRDRAAHALRQCPEVELVATRAEDAVCVSVGDATAEICAAQNRDGNWLYSYRPLTGDPLGLGPSGLATSESAPGPKAAYHSPQDWLVASVKHDFPAAVPRLWDGVFRICREQPDVVVSLKERWYVGSGALRPFVRMHGTHGGLHRRVSETFAMATGFEFPSPFLLADVRAHLCRSAYWRPGPGESSSP